MELTGLKAGHYRKIEPADCYTIIHEQNSVTRNIFTLVRGMSVSRAIAEPRGSG
jgi:hypothetical protein